jgi:peptide/nickel transport system ATP-binding protein
MAVMLITHDLGIVARIADRVAVMYAGQVVETGTVKEIFHAPLHPYTQGLLRCIPIPGRTRAGEHLGSIPGVVPSLVGEIKGCAFRNRCAHAFAACATTQVQLAEAGPGRASRCLLSFEQCAANALEAVAG